jgi:L-amino acid N-acyltransferase YncA
VAAVAAIHNQGIEERTATFETRVKSEEWVAEQIATRPFLVAASDEGGVIGFAKAGPYDDLSHYYEGVGEATIFLDRAWRGRGVGRALLEALTEAAREAGLFKLTAKIMAGNEPSLRLFASCGYRTVGTHHRHGRLEGEWLDVVVVERPLE